VGKQCHACNSTQRCINEGWVRVTGRNSSGGKGNGIAFGTRGLPMSFPSENACSTSVDVAVQTMINITQNQSEHD